MRNNMPFFTAYHPYRLPAVRNGEDKPLPENRKDVIARMIASLALKPEKGYRQNYTNGEFISSSLIIGHSLKAVSDRTLDLDGASDTAHFDPELRLWWRAGGCFD
jgi:hypothetical protein